MRLIRKNQTVRLHSSFFHSFKFLQAVKGQWDWMSTIFLLSSLSRDIQEKWKSTYFYALNKLGLSFSVAISHNRRSRSEMFHKIFIFYNFSKLSQKHLWWSSFYYWSCRSKSRTYSISLLCAIIARNHMPFFKIFSDFIHFCPNFQIFCLCLLFFWKIARMHLLSRIGPE